MDQHDPRYYRHVTLISPEGGAALQISATALARHSRGGQVHSENSYKFKCVLRYCLETSPVAKDDVVMICFGLFYSGSVARDSLLSTTENKHTENSVTKPNYSFLLMNSCSI